MANKTPAWRLPERQHAYRNHHLDSTRWDYFQHRAGDIVISTSYKAGTTWMQTIIGQLLFPEGICLRRPPVCRRGWKHATHRWNWF